MLYPGGIPLRDLVYRVYDLPLSMRPLVYDFGRLSKDAEKTYIQKIVKTYVSHTYAPMSVYVIVSGKCGILRKKLPCACSLLRY